MKLRFLQSSVWFPVVLLAITVLAFGHWALTIGHIWDDFPVRWIIYEYGDAGLRNYFSIDRPYLGWLYQVTTTFLRFTPITSQLFALFVRVLTALVFSGMLRLVWPKHADLARWSAFLFVVYPGFSQQYVAIIYAHCFLLIATYFASISLTILAVRRPKWFWWLSALSLALSVINLFCWEYYLFLDLLRPLLVWWVLGEQHPTLKTRLVHSVKIWLPYLFVFLASIYVRDSVQGYQTYQPVFFDAFKAAPISAVLTLFQQIGLDNITAVVLVWWKTIQVFFEVGIHNPLYLGVVVLTIFAVGIYFLTRPSEKKARVPAAVFLTCLAALLLAGVPFWLIQFNVDLNFPSDRFILPFMVGGSLLVAALLTNLPRRVNLPVLALLVGLSAGLQYQNGYAYRSDWESARRMFWQISWRMPGLHPNTALLLNDDAFTYYTDNSLSAPLNWIYHPEPTGKMDYVLLYPSVRLGGKIPALLPDQTITVDYRADVFRGSTSQVVVAVYQQPGCFRVLDPEVEMYNTAVQPVVLEAAVLSDLGWILPESMGQVPQDPFGAAPTGTWCQVYEQADLARQLRDWPAVIQDWENAQAAELWPLDAVEYLPFVEAFAHTGAWDSALDLSRKAAQPGSQYPGMVCRLWERIERETAAGPQQAQAIRQVRVEFGCE